MDWLQIASSLGMGGVVGAILGVLAASQTAKQKFEALNQAVVNVAPEHRLRIQAQFEEFRGAFDRLKGALEQLGRAMKRKS